MDRKPNAQWSTADFQRLVRSFKDHGYDLINPKGQLYVSKDGVTIGMFDSLAAAEEWIKERR